MRLGGTNKTIKIGTPKELGLNREEYLPKLRKLYRDNSKSTLTRLSKDQLKNGTLRDIPFFEYFDEWVQYKPKALQVALDKDAGIVGFFGSPIELPAKAITWWLRAIGKAKAIPKELRKALDDPNNVVCLNTTLCVDKNFRKQGLGKNLKLESEECLKKLRAEGGGPRKIILITGHETDNLASSSTQDSLGYMKAFEYKYPWPFSLNFTIRAKIIDIPTEMRQARIFENLQQNLDSNLALKT